ncbi:MAG: hypothetical protein PHP45_01785 [Elusimicrobiales bacterium]|nr:hypothetical protein [Elusimicrobiales bacterium]
MFLRNALCVVLLALASAPAAAQPELPKPSASATLPVVAAPAIPGSQFAQSPAAPYAPPAPAKKTEIASAPSRPPQQQVYAAKSAVKTAPEEPAWRQMPSDKYSIGEEFPIDRVSGFPSAESEYVSADWRADGSISRTDLKEEGDDFAQLGDIVELDLAASGSVRPGDVLLVYRRGYRIEDAGGGDKLLLQRSALLRVTMVKSSAADAEIVRIYNSVEKGDVFKRAQGTTTRQK